MPILQLSNRKHHSVLSLVNLKIEKFISCMKQTSSLYVSPHLLWDKITIFTVLSNLHGQISTFNGKYQDNMLVQKYKLICLMYSNRPVKFVPTWFFFFQQFKLLIFCLFVFLGFFLSLNTVRQFYLAFTQYQKGINMKLKKKLKCTTCYPWNENFLPQKCTILCNLSHLQLLT
jgi:hypothetical protein